MGAIEEDCDRMRDEKVQLHNEYENMENESRRLQEELFAKSTLIERLKGKLGGFNTHAHMHMHMYIHPDNVL